MLYNEDLNALKKTKAGVYGSEGEKIGTLGQVYLDDGTGLPNFATVKTGHFGGSVNFVPLDDAEISNSQLHVGFTKQFVKDAPHIDPRGHLGPEDEDRLYDYYSQAGLGAEQGTAEPEPSVEQGTQEPEPSEDQDHAEPVGLVQGTPLGAEEHLRTVGGEPSRPRIRKYIVTERHTETAASPETDEAAPRAGTDADAEPRDEAALPAEGRRDVTGDDQESGRPRHGEHLAP
ncbi:PRC-barrel domain-containing protein [Paeniglutamicibacter sp. MACA_103]|uniref:PRC-barrel domain-containing protein n=1 Tax=Paeniglutamicibacter sp. MACA_103 TaxID=3377337 RepID=UPI003896226A